MGAGYETWIDERVKQAEERDIRRQEVIHACPEYKYLAASDSLGDYFRATRLFPSGTESLRMELAAYIAGNITKPELVGNLENTPYGHSLANRLSSNRS